MLVYNIEQKVEKLPKYLLFHHAYPVSYIVTSYRGTFAAVSGPMLMCHWELASLVDIRPPLGTAHAIGSNNKHPWLQCDLTALKSFLCSACWLFVLPNSCDHGSLPKRLCTGVKSWWLPPGFFWLLTAVKVPVCCCLAQALLFLHWVLSPCLDTALYWFPTGGCVTFKVCELWRKLLLKKNFYLN